MEVRPLDVTEEKMVGLQSFIRDLQFQVRSEINTVAVQEYARLLMDDENFEFDPVTLVQETKDGVETGKIWLVHGWHRVEAYSIARRESIPALIKQGNRQDAYFEACRGNSRNGQTWRTADRILQAKKMLADPEMYKLSDRAIADVLGLSAPTISKYRKEMFPDASEQPQTRIGKDGRERSVPAQPPARPSQIVPPQPVIFDDSGESDDYTDVLDSTVELPVASTQKSEPTYPRTDRYAGNGSYPAYQQPSAPSSTPTYTNGSVQLAEINIAWFYENGNDGEVVLTKDGPTVSLPLEVRQFLREKLGL